MQHGNAYTKNKATLTCMNIVNRRLGGVSRRILWSGTPRAGRIRNNDDKFTPRLSTRERIHAEAFMSHNPARLQKQLTKRPYKAVMFFNRVLLWFLDVFLKDTETPTQQTPVRIERRI